MTQDPLATLLRLRQRELDTATSRMAELQDAESLAARAEHAAREAMRAEERAASDIGATDAAAEAFVRWLPVGRRAVADAVASRDHAATGATQARAALTLARGAVEAIQALLDARATQARAIETRRTQHALDEAALAGHLRQAR